jgi:hypothetical protein
MGLDLVFVLGLLLILVAAVALLIVGFRQRGRVPQRQESPVFSDLSDQVGRAAEEGTFIHVTLGSRSLLGEQAMTSLAALEGITGLTELSAAYDTPPIMTTGDPTLYVLADDWMRRAYARLGNVPRYRPTLVQFIASSPVTYAAMAATYLYEGGVGSNVVLGGFDQEISFLTDIATRRSVPTVGGTPSLRGMSALLSALSSESSVLGEAFFAGGAMATGKPTFLTALRVEHLLRWLVIGGMVVLAVLAALGLGVR